MPNSTPICRTKYNPRPGEIHGEWTVVSEPFVQVTGSQFRRRRFVQCRCTCGAVCDIIVSVLGRGESKKCRSCNGKRTAKHGHWRDGKASPEHMVWAGMLNRCHCPSAGPYAYYGARGISVCERWRNSFEEFLADLGPRPSPLHSLDRIDVDGDYTPENCRWALPAEQARNKRTTLYIECFGERLPVATWAERTGLPVVRLRERLHAGWSPERILMTPIRKRLK